jgi:hypothetical protein
VLAGSGPGVNIIGVLIVWRGFLPVDVPLSAVIASEFASTSSSRGHLMTTVFTARGWRNFGTQRHYFYMEAAGNTKLVLAATLVALIAFHAYRDSILTAYSSAL